MKLFYIISLSVLLTNCNSAPQQDDSQTNTSEKIPKNGRGVVHGEVIMYYPNGKIRTTINFHWGIKYGKAITYYENGNIQEIGNYNQYGELQDSVCIYYPNGKLKIQGIWNSNIAVGNWLFYNEEGVLKKKFNYISWDSAYVKEYDDNGIVKSEGLFLYGAPIGVCKFYENNKLVEIKHYETFGLLPKIYKDNFPPDLVNYKYRTSTYVKKTNKIDLIPTVNLFDEVYFDNGNFRSFKTIVNDSLVIQLQFNNEGIVEELFFIRDRKRNGYNIQYNSLSQVIVQYITKNDSANGDYFVFSEDNNKIINGQYKNNLKSGEFFMREDNGVLVKATFVNDTLQGKIKKFSPDGLILLEGNYVKGKKEGNFILYNQDNSVKRIEVYKGDMLAEVKSK